MMVIGMSSRQLFQLVLLESVWLTLFGLVLGELLTAPWYWYLNVYGIDLSSMMGKGDHTVLGVLINLIIRIRLYTESILTILSTVFGLSLLSGIYPAWRAGCVPPIESLRTI